VWITADLNRGGVLLVGVVIVSSILPTGAIMHLATPAAKASGDVVRAGAFCKDALQLMHMATVASALQEKQLFEGNSLAESLGTQLAALKQLAHRECSNSVRLALQLPPVLGNDDLHGQGTGSPQKLPRYKALRKVSALLVLMMSRMQKHLHLHQMLPLQALRELFKLVLDQHHGDIYTRDPSTDKGEVLKVRVKVVESSHRHS
jgi:hypothetical protein